MDELRVFTGNANPELAARVCKYLGTQPGNIDVCEFNDGETMVKINENIRGVDVFVFQSTFPPAKNLIELLVMLDAAKRASARRVTAVVPYFGYARQDRKDQPRVAITAKLVANLITVAGADRVLTMDLHSPQIQGFFDIPFDHLYAAPVLIDYFQKKNLKDLVIVSPDIGSVKMARAFAKRLGASLVLIDKRRPRADVAEVVNVIGEVEGRDVVILDDLISTAGTTTRAAEALKKKGARRIVAGCTHPVLCGDAVARLGEAPVEQVVVTDTIPHAPEKLISKIEVLSVADLLGEAIRRIHEERSLSSLFV
ncbi:MAG: ribose-phosphate pyrophosphokinase [Candidatus Eiseniibacteriota bacterium]|nr:MAG: ribose-phosphate pyrophosphokinase [Candidatus Eisenbacteria bacterium]